LLTKLIKFVKQIKFVNKLIKFIKQKIIKTSKFDQKLIKKWSKNDQKWSKNMNIWSLLIKNDPFFMFFDIKKHDS